MGFIGIRLKMEEDIGQRVMDKLDELEIAIDKVYNKTLKKNSHLHIMIETEVLEAMKKEAQKSNISLSEWCRQKLRENGQLDRIENKLDKLLS